MPRFGVVVFPGSNCDHDCYYVLKKFLSQDCEYIWHQETDLEDFDCIVIPGGFSYGDYLRTGSIARFSPVMESVKKFADTGKPVIGICNGFQILVESGILKGAFIKNSSLKFVCRWTNLVIENTDTPFTKNLKRGDILRIPVANGEGNYYTSEEQLKTLKESSRIVFRYCDTEGNTTTDSNPNGSIHNIAGICNSECNVLGMMPHPERSYDDIIGGSDGRQIFESVISWIQSK
ncbi:MAG: phosphoribosylformylglycinamidine synthase subunit PurQ [Thermodesulfobacteriota bacterium]